MFGPPGSRQESKMAPISSTQVDLEDGEKKDGYEGKSLSASLLSSSKVSMRARGRPSYTGWDVVNKRKKNKYTKMGALGGQDASPPSYADPFTKKSEVKF